MSYHFWAFCERECHVLIGGGLVSVEFDLELSVVDFGEGGHHGTLLLFHTSCRRPETAFGDPTFVVNIRNGLWKIQKL